jgi:nucleotide-binding universal stress UspA family protein
MMSLMVALKERQEAERLTAVAAYLAEPATEIHVVHVVEIGLPHTSADADGMVEDAVELLRARGIIAKGLVEVMAAGTVAGRLTRVARASDAEVVVMGSRGLGRLGGLFGRSVSHALLADLGLPVLIVPANAEVLSDGFRHVLAAVRSEDELEAAAAAIRLLRPPVEVMAVHVPRLVAAHSRSAQSSAFIEVPEVSGVVLAETRRRLHMAGISAATRSLARSEGVAASITGKARSWNVDIIVLGSRRLHDWEALIAGSTSHDVLHLSDRPVLISGRSLHSDAVP